MVKQLALVTGCDTGIGKALVDEYLQADYFVIATYLNLENALSDKKLFPLEIDQRSDSDIQKLTPLLFEKMHEGFELSVVILNAGIAAYGPIETLPMELFQNLMEVNFFGTVKITQLVTPHLKKSQGKLVIQSSLAGKVGLPFFAPYAASKFALEGFAQSLRRELHPFGIRVIVLNTGAIATPIWNKGLNQELSFITNCYKSNLYSLRDKMIANGNRGLTVKKAASRMKAIISRKRPPCNCYISRTPLIDHLMALLPVRVSDQIIMKLFAQYSKGE